MIPWTTIISFALHFSSYLMARSGASDETKRKFRDFVDSKMQDWPLSAKFQESWLEMRKNLGKETPKIDEEKPKH